MRLLILVLALFLLFMAASSLSHSQVEVLADFEEPIRVRIDNVDRVEINRLIHEGVQIEQRRGTQAWAHMSMDRFHELKERGYDVTLAPTPIQLNPGLAAGYHTFGELTSDLQAVAAAHPEICRLYNIGNSYHNRALWFMKISDNVDLEEDEPEFKYISSMHGDEPVGMELCLNLIHLLAEDYGTDPQITQLVNDVEIWIMPLMNPDGYTYTSRLNAQGIDLNRDFPDRVVDPNNTPDGRAVETQHVMNWAFNHSPVLSANFHTGALVVNYPYDSDPNPYASYSATPDDALIIQQSLAYSSLNGPMFGSPWFSQGITNGIAWYLVYGGMQDWNYVWMGCNDVTIELSDESWPSYSKIPTLWSQNRDSMLAYMEECLKGVRGLVTNSATGQPVAATVRVLGIDHDVYTDPDAGDYHRMLLPGAYMLQVTADDYYTQVINFIVSSGDAVRVDVALNPMGELLADADTVSAVTGGTVELTLMAGVGNASRNYILLGSITGTSPGTPLPGGFVTLPLNWDLFTNVVIDQLNSPVFTDFLGSLDGSGNAFAQLNLPPLPHGSVGVTMHYAFTLGSPFNFASNPVGIEIVP